MRPMLTKAALRAGKPRCLPASKVIGLIGLQEDRNGSYRQGPSRAPDIIREYFLEPAVNTWCELGLDVHDKIIDFGNVKPDLRHHANIFESVRVEMDEMQRKDGLVPLTLGGDHSITFAAFKAVREFVGKPLVIVHFDAHPDLYENFEDNPDSHASQFARICETPGYCQKLIQIGIRTLSGEQMPQIKKYGVEVIEARDFPSKGSDIRGVLRRFIPTDDTPVYISFDMDVIEPGLAPGVSHREAGGLTTRQVIDAIHCIPGVIVGADLVEYNPDRDVDFITASVAAKIMKELAGKIIVSQQAMSMKQMDPLRFELGFI